MNKVILSGNVSRDVEMRYTTGGSAVASTSLATNSKYKNAGGEYVEQTEFHELTLWGKQAEVWSEHVKKGQQMLVVGEIKYEKWEDKDQNKRTSTKIVVREFEFGKYPKDGQPKKTTAPTVPDAETGPDDDDVPF